MELAKGGHSVGVSVCYWPEKIAALERLRGTGCSVHQRKWNPIIDPLLRRLIQDHETWKAKRWLSRVAPDFVVLSTGAFAPDSSWCDACRQLRIPYAIIAQAVSESLWPRDEHIRCIREAFDSASGLFFVSNGNVRLVERMLGCSLPKARVVRNPFNVNYDVRCPFPEANGSWLLACVARLDPAAKGQDLLLEVLRQEKWRRRNIKVSFYGKGHNAVSVREMASVYGLENVAFCGHVEDIERLWRNHHLLVLPSRFEGLPLALVEAMLCARPAVVTDVAGNAEILEDGKTGFIAEAPTVLHLDEAMERAWGARESWQNMGVEAARRIRQLVPANPAAVFAEEIKRLAHASVISGQELAR